MDYRKLILGCRRYLKINIKRPFGSFVSGGLDSSLVSYILKPDTGYAVIFPEDKRSQEERYIDMLKFPVKKLYIRKKDFKKSDLEKLKDIIGITRNYGLYAYYKLCEFASKEKRIITGDGGDELFGGYVRYIIQNAINHIANAPGMRHYAPTFEEIRMVEGNTVTEMGQSEYSGLLHLNILEDKIAQHFGIEIIRPLMHPKIVEMAWSLPDHRKIRGTLNKITLRKIAQVYLPPKLLKRRDKIGLTCPVVEWLGGDRFDAEHFHKYMKTL